jgi:hypothetical protein
MGSTHFETEDPSVARLAALFLEHPAWVAAARHTREGVSSKVFFSHLPGAPWHLVRTGGESLLRPGPATSPDFAFRFTPASIARLAAVEGGVGDFAITLFSLILEEDEELQVGFRIIASFPQLALRGYLRLLLASGPEVLAFGARHGIARALGNRRGLTRHPDRLPRGQSTAVGCGRSPHPS